MNVIHTYLPIYQLYLFHLAQFFDYFNQIFLRFSIHDLSPILWNKHYMIGAIPSRMCYTLIVHLDTSYALIWPAKPISLITSRNLNKRDSN